VDDPLALAERRLAAGELRPALDALKEARAPAYAAGDRATLERIRELAEELQPKLGVGRSERSCAVLLVAVHESLALLGDAAPEPPSGCQPLSSAPGVPEPNPEPEPEPPSGSQPLSPDEPEPYVGEGVQAAHVEEAAGRVLEPGERLLGIFHGVVRTTKGGGGRGAPVSDAGLDDYLVVTDRGVVLWARGEGGGAEGYRYAEVTGAEPVGVFGRSVWVEVGGTRRWFSGMRRADAETAADLIRELAGLRP